MTLEPSKSSSEESIAIGVVVRPWGLDGGLVVEPSSDDLGRFDHLERVLVVSDDGRRPAEVLRSRVQRGRVILWLDLAGTREASEGLVGCSLEVAAGEAVELPEDHYFNHDLVGLRVLTEGGRDLGLVSDVLETAASGLLVVRSEDGEELLIPSVKPIVLEVDLASRTLTVAPPEGLLDVNRSGASC